MTRQSFSKTFRKFSTYTAKQAGSPIAFLLALSLVVGWFLSGFYFKWSEAHSFFINNTTTIITFVMTFIIQSSQNRDSRAMQLKLDEIIRALSDTRNKTIALEEAEDRELDELKRELKKIRDDESRG